MYILSHESSRERKRDCDCINLPRETWHLRAPSEHFFSFFNILTYVSLSHTSRERYHLHGASELLARVA